MYPKNWHRRSMSFPLVCQLCRPNRLKKSKCRLLKNYAKKNWINRIKQGFARTDGIKLLKNEKFTTPVKAAVWNSFKLLVDNFFNDFLKNYVVILIDFNNFYFFLTDEWKPWSMERWWFGFLWTKKKPVFFIVQFYFTR